MMGQPSSTADGYYDSDNNGENEDGRWNDCLGRSAPEVLKDIVTWYQRLLILPGGRYTHLMWNPEGTTLTRLSNIISHLSESALQGKADAIDQADNIKDEWLARFDLHQAQLGKITPKSR
ncbi:hypothetical protein VHEMI07086 [[Torrubiella] hemipterigena]|uniref:Uncharacterized protein n=1 Tax=[Torrubiella] hemipterigena TaxID=1531966 RepID=A0A0A1TL07_9HYPO|nr:hypothetical protein VHEMI07086 [[Torrubiella] hemipterigena]